MCDPKHHSVNPVHLISVKAVTLLVLVMFGLQEYQWEFRQAVVWTRMVVEDAKESDISTVVKQSFTGELSCSNCIAFARDRLGAEDEQVEAKELENTRGPKGSPPSVYICPTTHRGLFLCREIMTVNTLSNCRRSPPTPPPRSLFS